MAKTTTELALRHLRADGWKPEKTEVWNAFARKRHDLFGFGDIIALKPPRILIVQTTTRENISGRVKKIRSSEWFPLVAECGIWIWVMGWYKKDNGRWDVKIVVVNDDQWTADVIER